MSLTISVVIPCYNAAEYLVEAVSSVHRQTRPPVEIIVVDDGSTDGSAELAAGLDGVRVLVQRANGGPGAARNVGTAAARGDVIAWLDADDRWEAEHLACLAELLERHPSASVAFSRARQFGERNGEWPRLIPSELALDPFWTALGWCLALPSATAVRRDALLSVGGFDESLRVAEDFELWIRLARRGHLFICSDAVTCEWRQHGGNTETMHYSRAEYEVRHRLWRAESLAASDPEYVARLGKALGDIWERRLDDAWHMRSRAVMEFQLSMERFVPDGSDRGRAWRRKAILLPVLPLLDRARAHARRLGRAVRGGAAAGMTHE